MAWYAVSQHEPYQYPLSFIFLIVVAHAQSRHVNVDFVNRHSQSFFNMELHCVGNTIRHRSNARAIFNNDIDINIYILAVIPHRYAVRRFVGDGLRQALHQIFRRDSHHAVGLKRSMINNRRNSVGRDMDPAQRCSFFAHRFLLLHFTASYNTQNELTNCISDSKTPLMPFVFLWYNALPVKTGKHSESLQERIVYDG